MLGVDPESAAAPAIIHRPVMLQLAAAAYAAGHSEYSDPIYNFSGKLMNFKSFLAATVLALGVLSTAPSAFAADVHLFVRHEVADYATWRKAYDGFHATQVKMGVVAQAVYQSTDNPNDVTVTHVFHSLDKAKAFTASPELKAAMEKSGVKGAPQIWYTSRTAK